QLTASPEIQGIQEVYWKDRANNKRGPPTPDHTAAQLTASTFGVDINSTEALEEWLSKPVQTNKD
ncbi:unnamed protein product, partial [Symbiodinium pilosum]